MAYELCELLGWLLSAPHKAALLFPSRAPHPALPVLPSALQPPISQSKVLHPSVACNPCNPPPALQHPSLMSPFFPLAHLLLTKTPQLHTLIILKIPAKAPHQLFWLSDYRTSK